MRLFFHFANLYDGHRKSRTDVLSNAMTTSVPSGSAGSRCCSTNPRSFGGPARTASRPAHTRRLSRVVRTSKPAKTRDGFVITFKPDRTFFADYDRFYRKQQRGSVRSTFNADRQEIKEPLQVAYLFAEKRTGRPARSIGFVNSRDVETAKELPHQDRVCQHSGFPRLRARRGAGDAVRRADASAASGSTSPDTWPPASVARPIGPGPRPRGSRARGRAPQPIRGLPTQGGGADTRRASQGRQDGDREGRPAPCQELHRRTLRANAGTSGADADRSAARQPHQVIRKLAGNPPNVLTVPDTARLAAPGWGL